MNILVYEDSTVTQLYPVTIGRPAYAITCACYRLVDWLQQQDANVVCSVRPHLQLLQQLDFPFFAKQLEQKDAMTLVLNARVVPSVSNFEKLESLIGQCPAPAKLDTVVAAKDQHGQLSAAVMPTTIFENKNIEDCCWLETETMGNRNEVQSEITIETLRFPHDIIQFNQTHFAENLNDIIERGNYSQPRDGLFVGSNVELDSSVVANTKSGPIVVDNNAKIGPFAYLAGPVYIGPNCKVIEHASIKDFVCLTDTVKAGGEIEATIIEPHSNKQHHGFLGHSHLGSWINIGAGTCNSDLKNTYGNVNVTYGDNRVSTEMQFVGCFIGDYSKTAINTSIFTGKSIGVCSMLYGFVATNVPCFVNYARTFDQMTEVPPSVMETTQKRMFGRRKVEQRTCDIQLLYDMHELTCSKRSLPAEPLKF